MGLVIQLLGSPRVESNVVKLQPRGRKVWALLTYLLLTERPVGRQQLAALLFGEADDPLGALRWNLAELRRLLGQADALKGDHLSLSLPPGTYVDVRVLTSSAWPEASTVPTLGEELLASMEFPSLASEISDPCFLAKSEANLGLLHAARGDSEAALERLENARMWLIRTPDHVWTLGYVIDAACAVGVSAGASDAAAWINDLEVMAGRTGMREFLARAYVHRYNLLGRDSDREAAIVLAREVDSSYLHQLARTPRLATI